MLSWVEHEKSLTTSRPGYLTTKHIHFKPSQDTASMGPGSEVIFFSRITQLTEHER